MCGPNVQELMYIKLTGGQSECTDPHLSLSDGKGSNEVSNHIIDAVTSPMDYEHNSTI